MPSPVLYSTNTYLKYTVNQRFFGDVHYVWCSEVFDCTTLSAYAIGATSGASSDPCSIYRRLVEDVKKPDRHCSKIAEQKISMSALAVKMRDDKKISNEEAEEILYLVDHCSSAEWRPLIYVIPRPADMSRIQLVTPALRASIAPEFIIKDLKRDEFDIIEV